MIIHHKLSEMTAIDGKVVINADLDLLDLLHQPTVLESFARSCYVLIKVRSTPNSQGETGWGIKCYCLVTWSSSPAVGHR